MAVLIQALKSIGKDNVTEEHKQTIAALLQKYLDKNTYVDDLKTAPIWVRKIIYEIIKQNENELA